MNKLRDTWKDEAIAFCFLAIALVFALRAGRFFIESQRDKAPRLQAYIPREREVAPSPVVYATGAMTHLIQLATATSVLYYRTHDNQGLP